MPSFTPTKWTGAMAKASDVVYVEPELAVTDDLIDEELVDSSLNAPFVADLLSAMLAHERCGTHLYRSVAGRTNNPVLRRKYQDFGAETERHVEILESLVAAMGSNPQYVSPMARAVEAMDTHLAQSTFLVSGGLDVMTQEMAMLDAVFVAESIDHANWKQLAQLAPTLPEGELRTAAQAAVGEVEAQEDEHLDWASSTRAQMVMLQAQSRLATTAAAKAEEMVEHVRGWFRS